MFKKLSASSKNILKVLTQKHMVVFSMEYFHNRQQIELAIRGILDAEGCTILCDIDEYTRHVYGCCVARGHVNTNYSLCNMECLIDRL